MPNGYKGIFKCRQYCSQTRSGGIGIIYEEHLHEFIQEVKTNSNFVAWLRAYRRLIDLNKTCTETHHPYVTHSCNLFIS